MNNEKIPWPEWPVDNALALINESKSRHEKIQITEGSNKDVNYGILTALEYAVTVIEGIRDMTPPQPEPAEVIAYKAVKKFRSNLAEAFRQFADDIEQDEWKFPGSD